MILLQKKLSAIIMDFILVPVGLLAFNLVILLYLLSFSNSPYIEALKWLQLIAILIFVLSWPVPRWAKITLATLVDFLYLLLVMYYMVTRNRLDYDFLRRGIGDVAGILAPYYQVVASVLVLGLLNALLLYRVRSIWLKGTSNAFIGAIAVALVATPLVIGYPALNNELVQFAQSAYRHDPTIGYYQDRYDEMVKNTGRNRSLAQAQAEAAKIRPLPRHLENIIFLQIESLNAFLAGPTTTPKFLELARQGAYFPRLYGNSIQTILAQENILCALPSSFFISLAQSGEQPFCLPQALSLLGYESFFLKTFSLDFSNTGDFTSLAGFTESHAENIMRPGDPKYLWGYREDVFFGRAADYLSARIKPERNFIYLEVGPTNHWPFKTPADWSGAVPYPDPQSHRERLANTTFIQDSYLDEAFAGIVRLFPEQNYTVFLMSDHSWPAAFHPQNEHDDSQANIFNERGGFEENFLTAMAVIAGDRQSIAPSVIDTRYSLMDVMPTVLDLLGIKMEQPFSRSFAPALAGEPGDGAPILLVQPYTGRLLTLVDYPKKYQYSGDGKNLIEYDLANDPDELAPITLADDEDKALAIVRSWFDSK